MKQKLTKPTPLRCLRPRHAGPQSALYAAVLVAITLMPAATFGQYSTGELASGANEMIGQVAPALAEHPWVNSGPVRLEQLRGKVVLLCFFGPNPAGAAAVAELARTYQPQGLATIGIFAPSPMPTQTEPAEVKRLASALGFSFPIGIDSMWATVNRYWLNRADAENASATFLIDRKGVIRYIQPDGRYARDSRNRELKKQYDLLESKIRTLLKEPADNTAGERVD